MKKIIALWGHANCGKSTTLNILKDKLRQHGESLAVYDHDGEKLELIRYRETLVCVAPCGDNGRVTCNNIKYFKESGCEIAVSASRSKGAPVDDLESFAKDCSLNVRWFNMPYIDYLPSHIRTIVEHAVADEIMASIDRAISSTNSDSMAIVSK